VDIVLFVLGVALLGAAFLVWIYKIAYEVTGRSLAGMVAMIFLVILVVCGLGLSGYAVYRAKGPQGSPQNLEQPKGGKVVPVEGMPIQKA
jgi:membrane protein implicated in regulation of membrane protease activity